MSVLRSRAALYARHELRFGGRELVVFGLAVLAVCGVSFGLGVLVGRERAPGAGDPAPAGPPPRPPVAEADEHLTFYQTLTAPTTTTVPPTGRGPVAEHLVPETPPPAVAPAPGGRNRSGSPGVAAERPPPDRPRPAGRARGRETPGPRADSAPAVSEPPSWTVQVSSFRTRALAEEVRARLQARGFDAYVVSVSSEEGRVRHRVRVGGFATRAEAERVAAELRHDPMLNPFVTTRSR